MTNSASSETGEAGALGGLALLCTQDARITRVLRDDFGLLAALEPGAVWHELLDPSSTDKSRRFMADAIVGGAAFDWELGIAVEGAVRLFHFAAATMDDAHMLVVGAQSRSAVLRFYDEMMRINNEQANALRSALKNRALASPPGAEAEAYDRMMQLNNELATVQRELTKKNIELERANRLKNQFIGMTAHDLRNPIGAIRSFATILLDDTIPVAPDTARHFLSRIQASSNFMLRLIDDLLDISAIESGQLRLDAQPLDLGKLVAQNLELTRLLADDKGIAIHLEIAADVPRIMGDVTKLEQVATNLIGNAIKFSESGTTLRIELAPQDGGAMLAVADQGPGIPSHEIEQLFKPFGRASPRATRGERSTGLGLAIAKRIMDGHGGRLWCTSVVGQGTTFYAWLPSAAPSQA